MKKIFTQPGTIICTICFLLTAQQSSAQTESFVKRTVASGFNSAWEVVYGPNDSLWVTENRAYLISRVNILNGAKTVLVDLRATDGSNQFYVFQRNPTAGRINGIGTAPEFVFI